jgi:hypothetical protein
MSSGTKVDPEAGRRVAMAMASRFSNPAMSGGATKGRVRRLGMTPRQQELNHLWSFYRCCQYAARRVGWDGTEALDHLEMQTIASAGYVPPGFYDAGGAMTPLKFRRPSAPYHLAKVIVDRFTGLLFSERQHPQLRVEGDPDTEDFINALVEESRLWPAMIQARTFGGGMGTAVVGFQFVDGKPIVEAHDPRWIKPKFKDRFRLTLESFEKRYIFTDEEEDEDGEPIEVAYWYRRLVDEKKDVLFKPEPVGDGDEPKWKILSEVTHDLGFCPAVWMQNIPMHDDIDGEPDCHGVFDMIEEIDRLVAQAARGTIANCDPTLVLVTDAKMGDLSKGSDNAIKIPAGGAASYLEISGAGPTTAVSLAESLRKYVLEVARCVLEHPDTTKRTATEVERAYSSMIDKADVLREQYGHRAIIPLIKMMVEAARSLGKARRDEASGKIVRQVLDLPPRIIRERKDGQDIIVRREPRKLGPGGTIQLKWPPYFQPAIQDAQLAVAAASAAVSAGLLDREHAANHVAPYFDVDDVPNMLGQIDKEKEERRAAFEESVMANMAGRETETEEPSGEEEPAA